MHLLSKAIGKEGRRAGPSPQGPMSAVVWGRRMLSSQGESQWKGQLGKCEEVNWIFGLSKSIEVGHCVDSFVNKLNLSKERPYFKNQFPLPAN